MSYRSKEYMVSYRKQYYIKNKKKILEKNKKYRLNNKERHNARCRKYNIKIYEERPQVLLLQHAKSRAKQYNIPINITIEDIIVPEVCPIFKTHFERHTQYAMTLDRIDNSKGYIKGNVQVISARANIMKSDASIEELREFAEWILNQK